MKASNTLSYCNNVIIKKKDEMRKFAIELKFGEHNVIVVLWLFFNILKNHVMDF